VIAVDDALARLGTVVERSPFAYATSWPIEEVAVAQPDGTRLTVLVKRYEGELPRPPGLFDPRREAAAYRLVADAAPRLWASGAGWIAVEKLAGIPLWQSGAQHDWQAAARWAARLHARFAAAPPPRAAPLLCHDRPYYEAILRRAAVDGGLTGAARRAIDLLVALPRTLVHGELYPSNVLVAGERIAAVDWEMAALGPGVVDLAALVTGFDSERSAALVRAYGGADPRDLAAARLLLALQWLGWSSGWTAPPEHRHDWLAEAHAAAALL
jgi:Ser/Thr protein kinase RdoA (MazF antagonist)